MSREILDATLDPNPQWPAVWKWTYLLVFALGIAIISTVILVNMFERWEVTYPARVSPLNPVPYFSAVFSTYVVGTCWYTLILHRKYAKSIAFRLALHAPVLVGLALLLHLQLSWAWNKGVETLIQDNPVTSVFNLEDSLVLGTFGVGAYWVGLLTILTARKQWKWLGISMLGGVCFLCLVVYLSNGYI